MHVEPYVYIHVGRDFFYFSIYRLCIAGKVYSDTIVRLLAVHNENLVSYY